MPQKTLVVITGPTGVGKTAVAIRLARDLGTEIVSADSRQIFVTFPSGLPPLQPTSLPLCAITLSESSVWTNTTAPRSLRRTRWR